MDKDSTAGMVVVTEGKESRMTGFTVEILRNGVWRSVDRKKVSPSVKSRVHISRFTPVDADAVRVRFSSEEGILSIAEFGVYPK